MRYPSRAGSRLNAHPRDTAAPVSVFTAEFRHNRASTLRSGRLNFTVNSEVDTSAWQPGRPGQTPAIAGENLLNRTMVRGLAYCRHDLVAPREVRFTTTYSF